MRNQLLGFAIAVAQLASAQSWCPPGATWWHSYASSNPNLSVVARTICVGDTLIAGEPARLAVVELNGADLLLQQQYTAQLGVAITRAIGDAVSYWEEGNWLPLFDLGVPVGGQWILVVNGGIHAATVTATGQMSVDGELLRYAAVDFDEPVLGAASDTVAERIGYKRLHICPSSALSITGQTLGLRCYEDDAISYSALPSGTSNPVLRVPEAMPPGSARLVSTGSGTLRVLLPHPEQVARLTLHDPSGRLLGQRVVQHSEQVHANACGFGHVSLAGCRRWPARHRHAADRLALSRGAALRLRGRQRGGGHRAAAGPPGGHVAARPGPQGRPEVVVPGAAG